MESKNQKASSKHAHAWTSLKCLDFTNLIWLESERPNHPQQESKANCKMAGKKKIQHPIYDKQTTIIQCLTVTDISRKT